jgi:Ca2+-binding EF-hand superfamily protein
MVEAHLAERLKMRISSKTALLASALAALMTAPAMAQDTQTKALTPGIQKKYDNRAAEMERLDVNKDGILQASELQQGVGTQFDAADTNKDGIISEQERAAVLGAVQETGAEKVGAGLGERRAVKVDNRYNQADTNKDGQVSKEEYDAYFGARYQTYDRDGDGIISEKEFRTDYETLPSSYKKDQKKKAPE